MWVQADANKPIKHFHPRFPSESDPSLTLASALFAAFAFQKTPDRKDAVAGKASRHGHQVMKHEYTS